MRKISQMKRAEPKQMTRKEMIKIIDLYEYAIKDTLSTVVEETKDWVVNDRMAFLYLLGSRCNLLMAIAMAKEEDRGKMNGGVMSSNKKETDEVGVENWRKRSCFNCIYFDFINGEIVCEMGHDNSTMDVAKECDDFYLMEWREMPEEGKVQ